MPPAASPTAPPIAPPSDPTPLSLAPLRLPAPARKPARAGGRWLWLAGLAVLLVGLAALAGVWAFPRRAADRPVTAVAVRGTFDVTVTDRGELESADSVKGRCEIEGGGKLATIIVEGTKVKKGDEVARFDTDQFQKSVSEQEVKWETADGKLTAAKSELEVQKNKEATETRNAQTKLILAKIDRESYEDGEYKVEVAKRQAALEIARKELKDAADDLSFTRELVMKGAVPLDQIRGKELNLDGKTFTVSQQQRDLEVYEKYTKKKQMTKLAAEADNAKDELERTKKSQTAATAKAASELRQAEKTADLEKKQLDRIRKQMELCVVKAPADGVLIYSKLRWWDDSSRIRAGATLHFQQEIFTLPDLDHMQVKLKVHESVVKRVQKGMTATLLIDALPGHILHGKVLSVATLASQDDWGRGGVKEYETVVSIDDLPKDAGLRPGMTAEVKIQLKTVADALTVPVSAVTEVGGKHVAYVVTRSGVERREVKIGDGNEQLVQVLEGVAEGEEVALDARRRAAAEVKAADKKDGK